MTVNRRILITAEPYGFGPSSKALAIAREFSLQPDVQLDFAGIGTALSAAEREPSLFQSIRASARDNAEALSAMVVDYDLVISVMEPSLALTAAAESVPCLYVDSLFWMWDWPDQFANHSSNGERLVRALSTGKRDERRRALQQSLILPMHEGQYVAHRVAELVLYQRYAADVVGSRTREACNAKAVGAIIDHPTNQNTNTSGAKFLVSISGLSNELTDQRYAAGWAMTVIDVLNDAIHGTPFEGTATRVGGNPDVLGSLTHSPHWSLEVAPWASHADFMNDLRSAHVFAAPPGITSIAESWAVHVPFFALPNQHYAHSAILERLRQSDVTSFPDMGIPLPIMPDDIAHATTAVLRGVTESLRMGGTSRTSAISAVREFLCGAYADKGALIGRQSDRLSSIFGSSRGASEVVTAALGVL